MFSIALIVFREVFEISLIISILMLATNAWLNAPNGWVLVYYQELPDLFLLLFLLILFLKWPRAWAKKCSMPRFC